MRGVVVHESERIAHERVGTGCVPRRRSRVRAGEPRSQRADEEEVQQPVEDRPVDRARRGRRRRPRGRGVSRRARARRRGTGRRVAQGRRVPGPQAARRPHANRRGDRRGRRPGGCRRVRRVRPARASLAGTTSQAAMRRPLQTSRSTHDWLPTVSPATTAAGHPCEPAGKGLTESPAPLTDAPDPDGDQTTRVRSPSRRHDPDATALDGQKDCFVRAALDTRAG